MAAQARSLFDPSILGPAVEQVAMNQGKLFPAP